jgi:hypothetical protein
VTPVTVLRPAGKREDEGRDESVPLTEEERIERWRVGRFVTLGFKMETAVELAIAGVDWHEAERLLAAGATKAQTRRILL